MWSRLKCALYRQTTGSAIGQASSTVGALVIAGYIQIFGPAHESLHEFLGMLAIVMITSVALVCVFAPEIPHVIAEDEKDSTNHHSCCCCCCPSILRTALGAIWTGIRTLPQQLAVFALVLSCVLYGHTAYNGAKGQFFGLVVNLGSSDFADTCAPLCSPEQRAYNDGVQLASGFIDVLFNVTGYLYSWLLPSLVSRWGMKVVLTTSLVPQMLLCPLAIWYDLSKAMNVLIIVSTSITMNTVFGLIVPVIVHILGRHDDPRLGLYVGALNSANCAGQFLNFLLSSALVTSDWGYALPVFVGGLMTALGAVISLFWFKIHAYSI